MDSNNMYQNQQNAGGESENNQNPYGQDQNYQDPYNQNTNYQQYSYNNNGNYQTPYNQAPQMDLEEPVKMSEWLISFLILMIPCVNIIMPFVWAFSGNEKKSKSNFFKASLIMAAIGIVLWFIFIIAIAALGGTMWLNLWQYY